MRASQASGMAALADLTIHKLAADGDIRKFGVVVERHDLGARDGQVRLAWSLCLCVMLSAEWAH